MVLMRFDPFRELDRLSRELLPQGWSNGNVSGAGWMPLDAIRRGDVFTLFLDLPGVDPSTIDLVAEKNVLTIKAERHYGPQEGDEILVRERPQGTFTRQVYLSDTFDLDNVKAHYENGVLGITVPVAEAARSRKIEVAHSGDGHDAITVGEGSGTAA